MSERTVDVLEHLTTLLVPTQAAWGTGEADPLEVAKHRLHGRGGWRNRLAGGGPNPHDAVGNVAAR